MEENFDTFQSQETIPQLRGSMQAKFMKQLNFKDNNKIRRQKRKVEVNVISKLREIAGGNTMQISPSGQRKISFRKTNQMQECWIDGVRIIGQRKGGQWHGDISIYYPNGGKFIGKYQHGVKIFGTFDFNNGYLYTGGFLGQKFYGQGQIKIPSGKSVKGNWKDNQIQGKAQIKYSTGEIYYGETQNFKKHGHGYLFFNNGYKYVGEFAHGRITGQGEYFLQQKLIGKGIWNDGVLVKPLKQGEEFQENMISISDMTNLVNLDENDSSSYSKIQSSIVTAQKTQKKGQHRKVLFEKSSKRSNTEQSEIHSKSDDHKTATFNLQTEANQTDSIKNSMKNNNNMFAMLLGLN